MALFACKCLNVSLKSDNNLTSIDKTKLNLSVTEQRDSFFHEELLSSYLGTLKDQIVHPQLLVTKNIGIWLIYSCLSCGVSTHATHNATNRVLFNKSAKTTSEAVESMKQAKNFSPVFHILVPERLTESVSAMDRADPNEMFPSAQNAISSLNSKLKSSLREKLEAVEESVRQYRDMKYAEFEAFKERMEREHKVLSSVISQNKNTLLSENKENLDSYESPLLPQQRRRLSSIKDAKKIKHHFTLSRKNSNPEDDMSDLDDVFDLESGGNPNNNHTHHSDADDSDSEANMTAGERYRMSRSGNSHCIARSVPLDVPTFANNLEVHYASREEDEIEPHDIAASIKALARSVHGDVFGDLPRPRFSTQI